MDRRKGILGILLVLFGIFAMVAGCGGGGAGSPGGGGAPSKISVITGFVSDGPITNARVALDLNRNGQYDSGEPFGITNEDGKYRIEYILDPGTEYLLVVDGSAALGTSDKWDNPGDGSSLTFTMFISVTAAGARNDTPVAGSYRRDVTPLTFQGYLKQLAEKVGGVSDANVANIINSTSGPVPLFQTFIKKVNAGSTNQLALQTFAVQVAGVVESSNRQQDLGSIKSDLAVGAGTVLDFSENKTFQGVSDSLAYQNSTVSLIGDMVISKPIVAASAADVVLTNFNTKDTSQILTFTVKPGSLAGYSTSVTPYGGVLELPEYSQIRTAGNVVFLGADLTTRDGTGVKAIGQWLSCTVASAPSNSLTGLFYYYFDGTNWVNGGAVTAGMNIRTAPFVIVKTGGTVDKTLNIEGLSQLIKPTVIIKGYLASDLTKSPLMLDAFAVEPPSDTVIGRIPVGFIISEVVVVDGELTKVSSEGKPFVTLPVTDTTQGTVVTTTLSTPKVNIITDQTLYSALKNGSQDQNFAGFGSYIDTKTVYRGIDMYLGLNIDAAVKAIINTNIDQYLDISVPVFYSGNGSFTGVTIDSAGKSIQVKLEENNASTVITWSFAVNRIVRTYRRDVTGGSGSENAYGSTYTFSNSTQNLINALLFESMVERSNGFQKISSSYEGSAVYNRTSGALVSANYYQRRAEANQLTLKTDTLDGLLTMENGKLSFNGSYVFNLRSYGAVGGAVNMTNGSCAKGYSSQDGTYFNNNDLTNANAIFSATSVYTVPTANPSWLLGVWSGNFTDSGNADHPGNASMLVTGTNATWWGQSFDRSRNYGTKIEVTGTTTVMVRLFNNTSVWATGTKISDTRIEGSWSYNGFNGSFVLTKTP